MQPEGIEAASPSKKKNPHRGGMDGDTFRHDMARKIQLQREQFGVQHHLPPPPTTTTTIPPLELEPSSPNKRKVTFHDEIRHHQHLDQHDQGMSSLLARLKRKHGGVRKRKRPLSTNNSKSKNETCSTSPTTTTTAAAADAAYSTKTDADNLTSITSSPMKHHQQRRRRPDLFFQGIAVLINGYTNPDNETLQRMLHRHGGDLEKYETIRLTHIVASQLSFAKSKTYRKMRNPTPVVTPQWIVDCVDQQKLLPHGPYLLDQVQEKGCVSVKSFWSSNDEKEKKKNDSKHDTAPPRMADVQPSPLLYSKTDDDFVAETTPLHSTDDDGIFDEHTDIDLTQYDSSPFHSNLGLHTQLLHDDQNELFHSILEPTCILPLDEMAKMQSSVVPMENNHTCQENSVSVSSRQDFIGEPTSLVCAPSVSLQDQDIATKVDDLSHQDNEDDTPSFQDEHQDKGSAPLTHSSLAQVHVFSQNSALVCLLDQTPASPIRCSRNETAPIKDVMPESSFLHSVPVTGHEVNFEREEDELQACDQEISEPCQSQTAKIPNDVRPESLPLNPQTDSKLIPSMDRTTRTDPHFGHRTTGTDPHFLEEFFNNSRLSFIGSFKQRTRASPVKASMTSHKSPGARRFVLHVDMDCFFAAVALRNFPQHRNKPVAISHLGNKDGSSTDPPISKMSSSECATCNYEARKFGVKKGMFLGRARELCPSLVVLPYDFEGYEEVSEQVADILYAYAAKYQGDVEQVSCDELYMELHLVTSDGESWSVAIKQIAEDIRGEIFACTDCTATIGIGANKLLAKLGTDRVKPNGCFVVQDYRDLMESLKVREIPGIGYSSERKLAFEGIVTVKDVWDLGPHAESDLCRILGTATGKKLLAFCHGKDDREVKPAVRKTIGAEINYGVRFDGPYGVDYLVNGLAKEVEKRMRGVGVLGSKLTLKVKQRNADAKEPHKFLGHGWCNNLSRSIDFPGRVPTNESQLFARLGMQLFQELGVDTDDVRGMGIVVSKLSSEKVVDAALNRQTLAASWLHAKVDAKGTQNSAPRVNMPSDVSDGIEGIPVNQEGVNGRHETEQEKESAANDDVDEDEIDLPPQSQIRMSQVMALPSPMKRKITRMLEAREVIDVDDDDDDDDDIDEFRAVHEDRNCASLSHQWKQTSVKSLFKLAAVKAGRDTLHETLGESVSLTQLACLPFDMQLELADGGVGNSKRRDSNVRPRALFPKPRTEKKIAASTRSGEPDLVRVDDDEEIDEPKPVDAPSLSIGGESERSFYLENVAPLKSFLDETNAHDEDAKRRVHEFLDTLVREGRLHQVVKLLRSIKNRRDDWGSESAYGRILDTVDVSIRDVTGCYLDRAWLAL